MTKDVQNGERKFANRLEDWRRNRKMSGRVGMTYKELASMIGVSDAAVARRYCLPLNNKNFSRPREDIMLNIQTLTMGHITPRDFYSFSDYKKNTENAKPPTP